MCQILQLRARKAWRTTLLILIRNLTHTINAWPKSKQQVQVCIWHFRFMRKEWAYNYSALGTAYSCSTVKMGYKHIPSYHGAGVYREGTTQRSWSGRCGAFDKWGNSISLRIVPVHRAAFKHIPSVFSFDWHIGILGNPSPSHALPLLLLTSNDESLTFVWVDYWTIKTQHFPLLFLTFLQCNTASQNTCLWYDLGTPLELAKDDRGPQMWCGMPSWGRLLFSAVISGGWLRRRTQAVVFALDKSLFSN